MSKPSQASTTPQLIRDAAATYGDQVFLEEGGKQLSFKAFDQLTDQVARSLIAKGIQPGDRIGVWAPNIAEWIIAGLGLQRAGAVLVTLNTRYKGNEAAQVLNSSGAKMVFAIGDFLGNDYPAMLDGFELPELNDIIVLREGNTSTTGASAAKKSSWDNFLTEGTGISDATAAERANAVQGSDTSDLLFTSGTTGAPKGVMTGHAQNIKTFAHWGDIVGLIEGDRYLVISPFFHSFGYKAGILVSLMYGVTLMPHDVFDAEAILKRIQDDKITVLPGPPTVFQTLLACPKLGEFDISTLQRATTGAAAIPVEMIHKMKDQLGFERVITAYGLTESCGLVTMCRDGDDVETIATTSGRAIPDVELRCVDGNNQPVASGEAGEIVVRGFNVMQGYFENQSATDEAIDSDGWLHTGDVGILDENGNLRITDRLKDMFISGGFNCYPAEIENAIANHPDVAMNAVIGIEDARMGEVGMAYIVLKDGIEMDSKTFINWCRDNMANYKTPRQVRFVDALPLNATGKVMKPELKKMAKNELSKAEK